MAAALWLVGSLLGLVTVLVSSPTWALVTERLGLLVTPLAAGFAAQVLLGALSYLVPVVLGGGPDTVRGTHAWLERGNALRVVLINVGLVVCVGVMGFGSSDLFLRAELGYLSGCLTAAVMMSIFLVTRLRSATPESLSLLVEAIEHEPLEI